MIVRDLGLITDQRFVQLHNVGVLRSKLVSRAVTADDYVFCHFRPAGMLLAWICREFLGTLAWLRQCFQDLVLRFAP